MTSEEVRALKLYSAMFSDFKAKISDENEKRVVECLRMNLKQQIDTLDTLSPEKEGLAEHVLTRNSEVDKVIFENIWALNNQRKKILASNLGFVNSM